MVKKKLHLPLILKFYILRHIRKYLVHSVIIYLTKTKPMYKSSVWKSKNTNRHF